MKKRQIKILIALILTSYLNGSAEEFLLDKDMPNNGSDMDCHNNCRTKGYTGGWHVRKVSGKGCLCSNNICCHCRHSADLPRAKNQLGFREYGRSGVKICFGGCDSRPDPDTGLCPGT